MKISPAALLSALCLAAAAAGPGRADDDVVGGFRQQAQGQRAVAQTGATSMKSVGGMSDIETEIRREFPPTETPESLKSYEAELQQEAVKLDKQRRGELPPDPAPAPSAPYVPRPDPTSAQLGAALAKLPPEFADVKGCDAAHQACKVVRLAKQWSGGARNQGQAGSCATFASIAALEAAYMREYGATIDFSKMWVIRALVGEDLSDAGMGLVRQRGDVKTYLGTYPDDLLSLVSKHGLCQEAAFPYNSYVAEDSDSFQSRSSWFKQNADKAYAKALTRFAKDYRLADDPKLAKAVAESADFKSRLVGFRSGGLENDSSANIRRFMNFGIPLFVGLYPQGGNRMGLTGGHAVVLAGYDMGMQSYIIRNSWGFAGVSSVPSLISFEEKRSGIALSDLAFIVGPKDIARACADQDAAPRELLAFCR